MRIAWLAILFAPSIAAADDEHFELGGFFGPRIFSTDALLGYNENQPYHPDLKNGMGIGARVGRPFFKTWFVPEFELIVVPTGTTTVAGVNTSVIWLEPRVQVRLDLLPERRLDPFVVVGGGAPIALSSARMTFNSGIVGEGYVGGGVRFDSHKGFTIRFDARVSALPSVQRMGLIFDYVNLEADFNIGIEIDLGKKPPPPEPETGAAPEPTPTGDKDEDNIADNIDKCRDRPEDYDNFEDADGCPEIDNDNDRVLDVADKCPDKLETINGYADDDGCPDTLPADVEALRGTVEGLLYAEGETVVRESAKRSVQKIAKTMIANPSIRVVLIGHTDDREAKAFAKPAANQPPPDVAAIAMDLAKARAEAVRQSLIGAGIPSSRVLIDGAGAEQPVADNATQKGRLANRRVEIKLFVPK
jgi:outer membrane protein OmpA-like peptidoglycan-associated protein